ncbi:MAG TPA: methyltransferase domain-containing protein [Gemmatimonadaceae bacterium]|nr:methyltransferase domain-containing protein [Gemmatimonadaceae bacterium]
MPSASQAVAPDQALNVEERARRSAGTSDQAIYAMVARALAARGVRGATLADVGCGTGNLRAHVRSHVSRYIGVDVVRYDALPPDVEFHRIDLDSGRVPLADGSVDVAAAIETIEHLENPRAFFRELVRLVRPGGWVIVTTPNQRSALSLLSLVLRGKHAAFLDVHYPTHVSALFEVDLARVAADCGLTEVAFDYSLHSRVPGTAIIYPRLLARLFPRALSDNLMIVGRKGGAAPTAGAGE